MHGAAEFDRVANSPILKQPAERDFLLATKAWIVETSSMMASIMMFC